MSNCPAGYMRLEDVATAQHKQINLTIKRKIVALTQRRWCTFKWLWGVKAKKCPVLSHTLQPFYSFTAVSVHTVSEIHPWGDHRAQLKAHENAPQEINSKMSEELSVGKDTLVITTFQLCLLCSPSPSTPPRWATFSHSWKVPWVFSYDYNYLTF